jgi:signal transduction histidine kinase
MPWRERALASGLIFTLDIPDALGTLWLDSVKVRQIVVSLLSNAVKFTPNGGVVTLTARRVAQARLTVDILPGDLAEYLEIEVCDSGIGFTPELLPKLFEAFHQGDAALARHHDGIGLGLAMVKSLVNLHGGAVRAYNTPEHGACVTVWLPWREHAEDANVSLVKADLESATVDGCLLKQEL